MIEVVLIRDVYFTRSPSSNYLISESYCYSTLLVTDGIESERKLCNSFYPTRCAIPITQPVVLCRLNCIIC